MWYTDVAFLSGDCVENGGNSARDKKREESQEEQKSKISSDLRKIIITEKWTDPDFKVGNFDNIPPENNCDLKFMQLALPQ